MKTRSLSLLAVCVTASIFVLLAGAPEGEAPPHPPQPRGILERISRPLPE